MRLGIFCRVDPPDRHAALYGIFDDLLWAATTARKFAVPDCDDDIAVAYNETADGLISAVALILAIRLFLVVIAVERHPVVARTRQEGPELVKILRCRHQKSVGCFCRIRSGKVLLIFGARKRHWHIKHVTERKRLFGNKTIGTERERRNDTQKRG